MIANATWQDALHVALNMREEDRAEVMATSWSEDPFDFAVECIRSPGIKLAVRDENGVAVCIGGVALNQPGIGQAWLVGTPDIGRLGIEVAHAARKIFKTMMDEGGIHRIQAHSAAFHSWAHQWLSLVGLKEESRLPKYGKNGEEFIVFSVLKGD